MSKEKRSALFRFLLSVVAVVVGIAVLGTLVNGRSGGAGEFNGELRGPRGQINRQPQGQTAPSAGATGTGAQQQAAPGAATGGN